MATVTYVVEGDEFYNGRTMEVWAKVGGGMVKLRVRPPKQCDGLWELHGDDGQVRLFTNYREIVDHIHSL